ncbi:MAG: glucose 1-dehydrogenase [Alphaproteobacteria bacterium]|nr:glucose 1-dehydrogenase [Alphaproteobacteria bacterium]
MAAVSDIFRLDGRTALVTGASSGLGRRFALTLARAGAKVALAARRVERLRELAAEIEAAGGRALPVALDVTRTQDIAAALDAIESGLGPIDLLVNNAGLNVSRALIDASEEDWTRVMDTDLKAVFFLAQAVGRRMIAAKRAGTILNIASMAAQVTVRNLGLYGAAKAGVVSLTRTLALEWARHGINVNALLPGYIVTELNRDFWETEQGRRFVDRMPRKRLGQPEDLDGALLLLCTPAGRFITGSAVTVDDGQGFTLA